MQILSVSFAILACIGAGIALFAATRSATHSDSAKSAWQSLSSLSSAVAALEVQTTRNTETLRKLSGMVYKRKQEDSASSPGELVAPVSDADRVSWKAALREKYGITPRGKS